jgi:hypothetical protein
MTLAEEIAARAEALSRLADGTARQIAAELMPLTGRVKTLERTLDEIYQNARQDAVTVRADNVVDLRRWRGE